MTRAGAITAHIAALPVAVLLSALLGLALPWHRAADIELQDTFFVVAHFHATVTLAVVVFVASLVVYRYGAINLPIMAAWALLIIHLASSVVRETGWLYTSTALMCFLGRGVGHSHEPVAELAREHLERLNEGLANNKERTRPAQATEPRR